MASPQLDRILGDLDAMEKAFDLTSDGLGGKLLKAATDGVKDTIAKQEDPGGSPWPELSESYAEWKRSEAPGKPIGELYGLMADDDEVEGTIHVQPDLASVLYGKTEEAQVEAEWFQEGDEDQNRPPRPFFDLTAPAVEAIEQILDQRFDAATK